MPVTRSFSEIHASWLKADKDIVSKPVDPTTTVYLEQRLADSEMRRSIMAKFFSEMLTKLAEEESKNK